MNRVPKPRKCPVCRDEFTPKRIGLKLTKVCLNAACVLDYAQGLRAKDFEKKTREMKSDFRKKDKSFQRDKAQKAFNEFIRLRDANLGCISCDKPKDWGGQWHASHWKSRGARPDLAFNEDNVHKACSICNNWLSGNVGNFKESLLLKIGKDRVERIEKNIDSVRYSASDYAEIHNTYTRKIKELKELASIKI